MNQIIELIKAFPWWPLTVLILAVVFRVEIRRIFARLQHLKYRDFDATFKEGLNEAEREASDAIPQANAAKAHFDPIAVAKKQDTLLRIAETSSRAAIVEAWREVEMAIREAAETYGITADKSAPLSRIVDELVSKELIPAGFQKVFERLNQLRNQAAQAPDFVLDATEAERFIQLALGISVALRSIDRPVTLPDGYRSE